MYRAIIQKIKILMGVVSWWQATIGKKDRKTHSTVTVIKRSAVKWGIKCQNCQYKSLQPSLQAMVSVYFKKYKFLLKTKMKRSVTFLK